MMRNIRIQRASRLNCSCALEPQFEIKLLTDTPSKPFSAAC
jgi:ferredoxin